ncbi:MAG: DUF721 domain-containing protein, partial [Elainellaceae cyanobacterium]
NSVENLIRSLEQQPNWQQHRRFQRILSCWKRLVGDAVAQRTRPVGIQRDVLQVAVCNAVWAQTLGFERQNLLKKLNAEFSAHPFGDIRFSTAQWHSYGRSPSNSGNPSDDVDDDSEIGQLWKAHPSQYKPQHRSGQQIPASPAAPPKRPPTQVPEAFQQWADTLQRRSQELPLCPQCRCPAPIGELKRWSVCSLCAVKDWDTSRRP